MSQDKLPASNSKLLLPSNNLSGSTPTSSLPVMGVSDGDATPKDALSQAVGTQLKQAGEQAQVLAGKAMAMAAEKAPEVKAKVLEASAKVGGIATEVFGQTKETLKNPELRAKAVQAHGKKAGMAVGALVVMGVVGWFAAGHVASSRAKDAVEGFLIRNNLQGVVSYGDVSATPFGNVTISQVRIVAADLSQPIQISSVSISDFNPELPWKSGKVAVKSAQVPVLDMAKRQHDMSALGYAALGYTNVMLDSSLSWSGDNNARKLSVISSGEAHDVGSWKVKLDLANIDPSGLASLPGLYQSVRSSNFLGALPQVMQALSTLSGTSLSQADISIDDSDFAKRESLFPNAAVPGDGAAVQAKSGLNEVELVRDGMNPSDARAAAAAAGVWIKKGGSLRVTTHLNVPMPLIHMGSRSSFFGSVPTPMPAFDSFSDFLAKTNSTVSN